MDVDREPRTAAGRALLEALIGLDVDNDEGEGLHDILAIEAEARAARDAEIRAALSDDGFARAFVHIRGAHNPTSPELDEAEQETLPCSWCRLAGEQAADAVLALLDPAPEVGS